MSNKFVLCSLFTLKELSFSTLFMPLHSPLFRSMDLYMSVHLLLQIELGSHHQEQISFVTNQALIWWFKGTFCEFHSIHYDLQLNCTDWGCFTVLFQPTFTSQKLNKKRFTDHYYDLGFPSLLEDKTASIASLTWATSGAIPSCAGQNSSVAKTWTVTNKISLDLHI